MSADACDRLSAPLTCMLLLCIVPLATLTGAKAPPASQTLFNVRDFGAKADGVTDDVMAIQVCIDAAVKAGPGNTVLLPAGKYCLASDGVERGYYFRIPREATKLTVAGESGTLLLSAAGCGPFVADGSSGCAVRDLTVDFKKLNVTQGVVTGVNEDDHTIIARLEAGYPTPDSADFVAAEHYVPKLNVLTPGRSTFDWTRQTHIASVSRTADSWTFKVARKPLPDDVGRRFFIWGRQQNEWKPFVDLRRVRNGFTIDHVDDYAGGGFAGGGVSGEIRINRFYCGPPPGSDRLGFFGGHQGHSRADIVMTNSQLLMSNDDDMNALTEMHNIVGHPTPNLIELANVDDYQAGDVVAIWDYTDVNAIHVRETATVRSIIKPKDGLPRLLLDKKVTVADPGPRGDLHPNDDPHDRIVNLSSGGKITLKNCSFSSSFAHPLLLKSAKGIDIEGCRIFGSDMSGLDCGMQSFWNEGPQTCNVTLKHNLFYDIDGISCRFGIEVPKGTSSASRDQQNIVVEGNVFIAGGRHAVWNNIMPRGIGLLIGNVRGASVRGNVFVGYSNASIAVYSSEDVAVEGNVFLNAMGPRFASNQWPESAKIDAQSNVSISHSSDVRLKGNIAISPADAQHPMVSVSDDSTDVVGTNNGFLAPSREPSELR